MASGPPWIFDPFRSSETFFTKAITACGGRSGSWRFALDIFGALRVPWAWIVLFRFVHHRVWLARGAKLWAASNVLQHRDECLGVPRKTCLRWDWEVGRWTLMRGKKTSTKKKRYRNSWQTCRKMFVKRYRQHWERGLEFLEDRKVLVCMVMHGALPVGRRSLQELISWRPNQWICANVVSFNAALSCFRKAWPELKSPHLQKHSVIFELTYMDFKLWMCLRFAYEWPSDRGNIISKLANRRNPERTWLLRLAWSVIFS